MRLVDTERPNPDRFARTPAGKIDFEAYRGLTATYRTGELDFEVTIIESRQRFGHLDLLITPQAGSGQRWTEFKNMSIHQDPANSLPPTKLASAIAAASAEIEAEPETEEPTRVPFIPIPPPFGFGTHWTEVAPEVADDQPEVAATSVATDLEDEVAEMLGHVQIKD